MAKKAAVRLWHHARDLDRGSHQPGHHGGAVGPHPPVRCCTLIFDFLNHRTGRLDPSYAAIAAKAGVCVRTVATALGGCARLGILNWVRRCAESWRDGRIRARAWRPTPTPRRRRASGTATGRYRRLQPRYGPIRGGNATHAVSSRSGGPGERPAAKQVLAVSAMTPLSTPWLQSFQRSILAARDP